MSKLIVVRHAQARLFTDDYDRLSELGEEQSRRLAQYWLERGVTLDGAFTGTLRRQVRTAEVIAETFREAGAAFPEVVQLEGLNEYPADEIMEHLLPELAGRDPRFGELKAAYDSAQEDVDRYRTFHRLLEAVMAAWIDDTYSANGLKRWNEFRDGVRGAYGQIMATKGRGLTLAAFTSGGPVGVAVQTALQAPDLKAAELNWRIHNCSFTEFTFSGGRISLDTFNAVPHLTEPEMLTYR